MVRVECPDSHTLVDSREQWLGHVEIGQARSSTDRGIAEEAILRLTSEGVVDNALGGANAPCWRSQHHTAAARLAIFKGQQGCSRGRLEHVVDTLAS